MYLLFIWQEKFKAVVWQSEAYKKHTKLIEQLWDGCSDAMYNLDQRRKELGLGKKVMFFIKFVIVKDMQQNGSK